MNMFSPLAVSEVCYASGLISGAPHELFRWGHIESEGGWVCPVKDCREKADYIIQMWVGDMVAAAGCCCAAHFEYVKKEEEERFTRTCKHVVDEFRANMKKWKEAEKSVDVISKTTPVPPRIANPKPVFSTETQRKLALLGPVSQVQARYYLSEPQLSKEFIYTCTPEAQAFIKWHGIEEACSALPRPDGCTCLWPIGEPCNVCKGHIE